VNLVLLGLTLGALTIAAGAFLIWKGKLNILNPIRAFAVLCVAVISGFVMYMRYWQIEVLASPDWCNRAMKAEQLAASSRLDAALACVGLQGTQIKAIATNSYIDGGTIAFCLLTLIVIVIAGGRLNFSASKTGVSANIGKDDDDQAIAAAGAAQAAEAAKDEAKAIAGGAHVAGTPEAKPAGKFTPPPNEEL
jgi:hypothetical protein